MTAAFYGEVAARVFGAFVGQAWPIALVGALVVAGQAAVLAAATRAIRPVVAWWGARAARVRTPIAGELWAGPSLGTVTVVDVDCDPLVWLMSAGRAATVTFEAPWPDGMRRQARMSHGAWIAAGMTPIPRAEWDDYLKHGKVT